VNRWGSVGARSPSISGFSDCSSAPANAGAPSDQRACVRLARGSMNAKRSIIVYLSFALVLLCWLTAPRDGSLNEPTWTLPQDSLQFDATRAMATLREFVTRYPKRVLGSVESRQSTGFLKEAFTGLGYEISYTQFDARINGRGQVGRNVLAYKAGQAQEIIAVAAHYDTSPTTVQGAMANGSGVSVMLELARIFAQRETKHSLLFIATDGSEWGQLGARDIVEYYPQKEKLACVLSLDHVAVGELRSFVKWRAWPRSSKTFR
jgi:hypothetical protein